MKKLLLIGLLVISNFISAQALKNEDDVVRYLDNANNLDLVEGIYHLEYQNGRTEYWKAVVYNKTTGDFEYFDIDPKTRCLKPYCGKYETHLVRATKYAYTYYVYVIINGKRYDSSTTYTFGPGKTHYHWVCVAPIDGNWHVSLNLEDKVYPN